MDRVDPGRARIGHDDAGRAEDRQAADDAEIRPFAVRSAILSPPGTEISTIASTPALCCSATSARLAQIIARGAGSIAGSPGWKRQALLCHLADAFAGLEAHARSLGCARRTVATMSAPWVMSAIRRPRP